MRIFPYLLLTTLLCTPISHLSSAEDSFSFEGAPVKTLLIQEEKKGGLSSTEEKALRMRLETKEGFPFSQTVFDRDLKLLSKEYDEIVPSLERDENGVVLKLHLFSRPIIQNIVFEGNKKTESKELQTELNVGVGSLFDRSSLNQGINRLRAYFIKKAFFEAEVSYEIKPLENNEVEVIIHVEEGRAGKIQNLRFKGFTKKEEEEILEKMYTKTYKFFLSWITDEGKFNEAAMDQDILLMLNLLQNRGYADAKVTYEITEAKDKERINVEIIAEKGELYKFGSFTLEGNTLFQSEELFKLFAAHEGQPYSQEKIQETIQNISSLYGKKGYIDAYVAYDATLNPETLSYNVHFFVDEGSAFHVGVIKVFGNTSTETKIILHETLLIPGEVFNSEKLKRTEERLKNIGFFKNVNVYAVKPQEGIECDGYRDIHIEVEETSTGKLGGFLAYSTVEDLFGGVNITESNFNYKGFSSLFSEGFGALRGGGEYLHGEISVGQKSRNYTLSWTKPFFNDTKWTVGFDVEQASNRYVSQAYDINTFGGTAHADYQINAFLRTGLHYRLKHTQLDITDHDFYASSSAEEDFPSGSGSFSPTPIMVKQRIKEESENSGVISAIGSSLVYDSTDNPLKPSRGVKSRLETEFAGIFGNKAFLGFAYLNTVYYPIEKGIVRLRGDVRFLQPIFNTSPDTMPIDERLFLGGNSTVRGFRPYAIGPQYADGDPKGGVSMQFLSAQYSRPLFSRVDAFAFIDAGHLSLKPWNFGRISTSVGYGIYLYVFEGAPPLTVGFGYPLNAKSNSDVKRFFLSVGTGF